jgi:hypothetical protein
MNVCGHPTTRATGGNPGGGELTFYLDPNGKVTGTEGYQRWSEALEAAGLSD